MEQDTTSQDTQNPYYNTANNPYLQSVGQIPDQSQHARAGQQPTILKYPQQQQQHVVVPPQPQQHIYPQAPVAVAAAPYPYGFHQFAMPGAHGYHAPQSVAYYTAPTDPRAMDRSHGLYTYSQAGPTFQQMQAAYQQQHMAYQQPQVVYVPSPVYNQAPLPHGPQVVQQPRPPAAHPVALPSGSSSGAIPGPPRQPQPQAHARIQPQAQAQPRPRPPPSAQPQQPQPQTQSQQPQPQVELQAEPEPELELEPEQDDILAAFDDLLSDDDDDGDVPRLPPPIRSLKGKEPRQSLLSPEPARPQIQTQTQPLPQPHTQSQARLSLPTTISAEEPASPEPEPAYSYSIRSVSEETNQYIIKIANPLYSEDSEDGIADTDSEENETLTQLAPKPIPTNGAPYLTVQIEDDDTELPPSFQGDIPKRECVVPHVRMESILSAEHANQVSAQSLRIAKKTWDQFHERWWKIFCAMSVKWFPDLQKEMEQTQQHPEPEALVQAACAKDAYSGIIYLASMILRTQDLIPRLHIEDYNDHLQRSVKKLEDQLTKAKEELAVQKRDYQMDVETRRKLGTKIEKKKEIIAKLKGKLREEVETIKGEGEEILDELETTLKQVESDRDAQLDYLRGELERVRTTVTQLKEENEKKDEQIRSQREEVETLKAECQTVKVENESLRASNEQLNVEPAALQEFIAGARAHGEPWPVLIAVKEERDSLRVQVQSMELERVKREDEINAEREQQQKVWEEKKKTLQAKIEKEHKASSSRRRQLKREKEERARVETEMREKFDVQLEELRQALDEAERLCEDERRLKREYEQGMRAAESQVMELRASLHMGGVHPRLEEQLHAPREQSRDHHTETGDQNADGVSTQLQTALSACKDLQDALTKARQSNDVLNAQLDVITSAFYSVSEQNEKLLCMIQNPKPKQDQNEASFMVDRGLKWDNLGKVIKLNGHDQSKPELDSHSLTETGERTANTKDHILALRQSCIAEINKERARLATLKIDTRNQIAGLRDVLKDKVQKMNQVGRRQAKEWAEHKQKWSAQKKRMQAELKSATKELEDVRKALNEEKELVRQKERVIGELEKRSEVLGASGQGGAGASLMAAESANDVALLKTRTRRKASVQLESAPKRPRTDGSATTLNDDLGIDLRWSDRFRSKESSDAEAELELRLPISPPKLHLPPLIERHDQSIQVQEDSVYQVRQQLQRVHTEKAQLMLEKEKATVMVRKLEEQLVEAEERFVLMRKESDGRFVQLRKDSDELFAQMRKESEERVQAAEDKIRAMQELIDGNAWYVELERQRARCVELEAKIQALMVVKNAGFHESGLVGKDWQLLALTQVWEAEVGDEIKVIKEEECGKRKQLEMVMSAMRDDLEASTVVRGVMIMQLQEAQEACKVECRKREIAEARMEAMKEETDNVLLEERVKRNRLEGRVEELEGEIAELRISPESSDGSNKRGKPKLSRSSRIYGHVELHAAEISRLENLLAQERVSRVISEEQVLRLRHVLMAKDGIDDTLQSTFTEMEQKAFNAERRAGMRAFENEQLRKWYTTCTEEFERLLEAEKGKVSELQTQVATQRSEYERLNSLLTRERNRRKNLENANERLGEVISNAQLRVKALEEVVEGGAVSVDTRERLMEALRVEMEKRRDVEVRLKILEDTIIDGEAGLGEKSYAELKKLLEEKTVRVHELDAKCVRVEKEMGDMRRVNWAMEGVIEAYKRDLELGRAREEGRGCENANGNWMNGGGL